MNDFEKAKQFCVENSATLTEMEREASQGLEENNDAPFYTLFTMFALWYGSDKRTREGWGQLFDELTGSIKRIKLWGRQKKFKAQEQLLIGILRDHGFPPTRLNRLAIMFTFQLPKDSEDRSLPMVVATWLSRAWVPVIN